MSTKDHYSVLGVAKNATDDEIKQAYKVLAKKHHPDKGGSKETFQNVQEAYDVLSDANKRHAYDNPMAMPNLEDLFGAGGFPFGGGGIDLSSLFGNRNQASNKKSNNFYNINIRLDDVHTGIAKNFNIKRDIICKKCRKNCDVCNGTGTITQRVQFGIMIQMINKECHKCNGCGKMKNNNACSSCNTKGFISEQKLVELKIPKGVENKKRYIFKEWGEQPKKENEVAGDLIIVINIENHNFFERNDLHLKCNLSISLKESLVGKKIKIPYFDKPFEISLKDFGIINPNKDYVMFKKGLENDNGQKGNLYMKFTINYPDNHILNNAEIDMLNDVFNKIKLN